MLRALLLLAGAAVAGPPAVKPTEARLVYASATWRVWRPYTDLEPKAPDPKDHARPATYTYRLEPVAGGATRDVTVHFERSDFEDPRVQAVTTGGTLLFGDDHGLYCLFVSEHTTSECHFIERKAHARLIAAYPDGVVVQAGVGPVGRRDVGHLYFRPIDDHFMSVKSRMRMTYDKGLPLDKDLTVARHGTSIAFPGGYFDVESKRRRTLDSARVKPLVFDGTFALSNTLATSPRRKASFGLFHATRVWFVARDGVGYGVRPDRNPHGRIKHPGPARLWLMAYPIRKEKGPHHRFGTIRWQPEAEGRWYEKCRRAGNAFHEARGDGKSVAIFWDDAGIHYWDRAWRVQPWLKVKDLKDWQK